MKGGTLDEELRRYLGKYLRRLFYRSPVRREVFKMLAPVCIECQGEFGKGELEVEHIEPCVPTDRPVNALEYFRRMFSLNEEGSLDMGNLALMCSPCHKLKTRAEMGERARNKQGPYSEAAKARRYERKKRKAKTARKRKAK